MTNTGRGEQYDEKLREGGGRRRKRKVMKRRTSDLRGNPAGTSNEV